MRLLTIGFTRKSAETFFETLRGAGAARVLDVRLHNTSQLAGFAKRDDLAYLLRATHGIGYVHLTDLAPTAEMLDTYKKHKGKKHEGAWEAYEAAYRGLLRERRVEETLDRSLFDGGCLLCSEPTPHHCHRRVAAEYLAAAWGDVTVTHL